MDNKYLDTVEKFNIGDLLLAFSDENNIVGEVVTVVDFRDINYSGYLVKNSKGETYDIDKDQLIGIDSFEDLTTKRQEFLSKREEKANQIELTPELYKEMLSYIEDLEKKLEEEKTFKSEIHWNYETLKSYVLMDRERVEKSLEQKELLIQQLEGEKNYLLEQIDEYQRDSRVRETIMGSDIRDSIEELQENPEVIEENTLSEDDNVEQEEQSRENDNIEESELNLEDLRENDKGEEEYVGENEEQEEGDGEDSAERIEQRP